MLLVVLQFHGFRLVESAGSLGVEQGLLTRLRMRAPLAKIQRWTVYDSLLHRFFDRRSVRVETAALQAIKGRTRAFREASFPSNVQSCALNVQR